jgi:DNA-binding response OmpR family regulator
LADATPTRVLVVHADPGLRVRLAAILTARGHTVSAAPRAAGPVNEPEVIVADHRVLPVSTRARVLALVPADDELAILAAFASGADDVLSGLAGADAVPGGRLRGAELASRVANLARGVSDPARMRVGPIAIDSGTRHVTLAGRPLRLTRREYELLAQLAAAPGRVFTKQELLREVWAQPPGAPTRRLDTQVARLRRRLGEHRALLVTVWGVGYRLGA